MLKGSIFTAAIAVTLAMLLPISISAANSPSDTQPKCNARDKVVRLLGDKYKEAPVAVGITNGGKLVEVLSTDTGDTWTILITTPQGVSCLVAAGEGWREAPKISLDPQV